MRGGEKVLEALCELFPDADLFTLVHVPGTVSPAIERHRIQTSFVQRLPGAARLYRHYLPLFPLAIEQFDLDGYDLVISTQPLRGEVGGDAAGRARHLCYCLTPMRYAWDQFDAYFGPRTGRAASPAPLLRPVLARAGPLGRAPRPAASDRYLAISQYVARQDRAGTIIVDRRSCIPRSTPTFYTPEPRRLPSADFLVVSALVPYKRVDLAIDGRAARRRPLWHRRRRARSGPGSRRMRRRRRRRASWAG